MQCESASAITGLSYTISEVMCLGWEWTKRLECGVLPVGVCLLVLLGIRNRDVCWGVVNITVLP